MILCALGYLGRHSNMDASSGSRHGFQAWGARQRLEHGAYCRRGPPRRRLGYRGALRMQAKKQQGRNLQDNNSTRVGSKTEALERYA